MEDGKLDIFPHIMPTERQSTSIYMLELMCYLKLKLYDKALSAFEKAMEDNFDNSETFFYAAICLLKGRKAFLLNRTEIDKAEEYINAAIMIEPRAVTLCTPRNKQSAPLDRCQKVHQSILPLAPLPVC